MSTGPTVLLYTQDPAFFERRDTWFNRRGVDVFCAMDMEEAAAILTLRRVDMLVSCGVPAGLAVEELRGQVPYGVPLIVLVTPEDDEDLIDDYRLASDVAVITSPYGDALMQNTAKLLSVPTRHYIRILVQLQIEDQAGGFGFSNNLSATGMLVETKKQLEIGTHIQLSFLLPGARQMTAVKARVVREAQSNKHGSFRYGVQFVDLPVADREHIVALTRQAHSMATAAVA